MSRGSMTYTGSVEEGLGSGCGAHNTVLCECAGMSKELKLSNNLHIQLRGSDGAHLVALRHCTGSKMLWIACRRPSNINEPGRYQRWRLKGMHATIS